MLRKITIKIISIYQIYISSRLGDHCRFYPSCSQYFKEAIFEYGLFKGFLKGLFRIARCQPLSSGGFDPIIK